MKIYLSQEYMKYKEEIDEMVDRQVIYNPNFCGVSYEILENPEDFGSWIACHDENAGADLMQMIYRLVDELKQTEGLLNPQAHYTNTVTGSIDTGRNWLKDYRDRDDEEQSWRQWGGEDLVEIARNKAGLWEVVS